MNFAVALIAFVALCAKMLSLLSSVSVRHEKKRGLCGLFHKPRQAHYLTTTSCFTFLHQLIYINAELETPRLLRTKQSPIQYYKLLTL
jgi:hypothetical protein